MDSAYLTNLWEESSYHRNEVKAANTCGCFSCVRTFSSTEIKSWTDGGDTALCPLCGIDAVIPYDDHYVLQAMNAVWF